MSPTSAGTGSCLTCSPLASSTRPPNGSRPTSRTHWPSCSTPSVGVMPEPPMSSLQVSIRVPLGRPLPELADFAVRCEQAGLTGVGVPDHHHTGRDAYLALAAMALRTARLTLF